MKAVRNDRGALMNERSKRVQIERKKNFAKKKQRRRVLVSALVEVLILTVLAIAFCWNRGLEAKVSGLTGWFDGPPATGLDMSGVNSSNVVLMDVKSGESDWGDEWGGEDLSGFDDEDYDGNCGIGSFFRFGPGDYA